MPVRCPCQRLPHHQPERRQPRRASTAPLMCPTGKREYADEGTALKALRTIRFLAHHDRVKAPPSPVHTRAACAGAGTSPRSSRPDGGPARAVAGRDADRCPHLGRQT
jgi:hypothetical protein